MLKNVEFIFFHIEKCMGTTFRFSLYNYLKNVYKESDIFFPDYFQDCNLLTEKEYDFVNNLNNDFKVLLCHISFNNNISNKFYTNNTFSITIVRNPYTRILSHYYHFFYPKYKKQFYDLSDNEIIHVLRDCGNVISARLGCDVNNADYNINNFNILIRNVNKINCILIMEKINEDIELLNTLLNKKYEINSILEVSKINVNSSYKNNDKLDIIILESYKKHFKFDIKLYDYIISLPISERFKSSTV
jgi:hypothetical protein